MATHSRLYRLSSRCGWLLVLLTATGVASLHVDAASTARPSAQAHAAASWATQSQCRLAVQGNHQGTLSKADMDCQGANVTVAADRRLMEHLGRSVRGVTWDGACSHPGCLLTVCSHLHVVFVQSSIRGVRMPGVSAMLCVVGHAQLELQSATITDNAGRGLLAADRASLLVSGSTIAANVVALPGAGIAVLGTAKLVVEGASRVLNNTAVRAGCGGLAGLDAAQIIVGGQSIISENVAESLFGGGGACALGHASMTLQDASKVNNNSALGGAGGGLVVADAGSLIVAGQAEVVSNTAIGHRGGGISAVNSSTLHIIGATIANNTVVDAGCGGVAALNDSRVVISGQSSIAGNTASLAGGGLCARDNASLVLDGRSVVTGNVASGASGGGLIVTDQADVLVTGGSLISGNVATHFPGGGVATAGNATLVITGESVVADNSASPTNSSGGGLAGFDSSRIEVSGQSLFVNNTAFGGGAVVVGDDATLLITNHSVLKGNNATNGSGGGLLAMDSASVVVTGQAMVLANVGWEGGGIGALDGSTIRIQGAAMVANNTATRDNAGGVMAIQNSYVFISERSSISDNTAFSAGAALWVGDNASLVLNDSRVTGNMAANGSAGGLLATQQADVLVTGGSLISGNVATGFSGGGVAAFHNVTLVIEGASAVSNNTSDTNTSNGNGCGGLLGVNYARVTIRGQSTISMNVGFQDGGGLCIGDDASLLLDGGSRVTGNVAISGTGGGLSVSDRASVVITGRSSISYNTAQTRSGGGVAAYGNATLLITGESVVANNTAAPQSAGGGVAGFNNSRIVVSGRSLIANNTGYSGGAIVVLDRVSLLISDGSIVSGNDPLKSQGAISAYGGASVNLSNGAVLSNNILRGINVGRNLIVSDKVQLHIQDTVQSDEGTLSRCSDSVFLRLQSCGVGEYKAVYGALHQICLCCPQHMFSFVLNATGYTCEPCPPFSRCPGANLVQPLPGYWHSGPQSVQMHQCPMGTTACAGLDRGCQPGYQGNLCGSCALPAYGTTLPLKCGKCMPPPKQLGVYLVLAFVSVLFVAVTVHFTWVDNVEGSSHVRPSDAIRVLAHYLQYLVILGSLSAPWPAALRQLFGAASVVFGVATGQALSLDCWLSAYVHTSTPPLAIKRVLVAFLAPVFVFVACIALMLLAWAARWAWYKLVQASRRPTDSTERPSLLLLRKLPVLGIVVLFFAYPALTKASLGFFACLPIDDASKGPYAEFALANHTAGYWVGSIDQECFTTWHKAWALGLGIPSVLLFCIFLPVAMWLFLYSNKARRAELSFREHWGFLFRNYTDRRIWWEAVWALQTVILTCISVFHFTIRTYYAVLMFTFVFLISAVLHVVARPCSSSLLHRLHLASMGVLFSTSYCTLAMFTVKGQSTASVVPVLVSVLLLAINCTFIIGCLYIILCCTSATFKGVAASWTGTLGTFGDRVRSTVCGWRPTTSGAAAAGVSGSTPGVAGGQPSSTQSGCLPRKWARLSKPACRGRSVGP